MIDTYTMQYIYFYMYVYTQSIYIHSISGQVLKPIKASIYMLGSLLKYGYILFLLLFNPLARAKSTVDI